jgi:hypothetical protein
MTWFTFPVRNQLERTWPCTILRFDLHIDTKHYPCKLSCKKKTIIIISWMVTSNTLWYEVHFLIIFIITMPTKLKLFQVAGRAMLFACLTHSSVLKKGQYIPPTRQWSSDRLYSIRFQKIVFIIVTHENFKPHKVQKSNDTIMAYLKEEKGTVTHWFFSSSTTSTVVDAPTQWMYRIISNRWQKFSCHWLTG